MENSIKVKHNQNSMGVWEGRTFVSTMTKLTVYRAPVWVKNSKGKWVESGTRTVTVGVSNPKEFDFDKLYSIAVYPPTRAISVA
jgi:hypothetical protein